MSSTPTMPMRRAHEEVVPPSLPRLLEGIPDGGHLGLHRHVALHGPQPRIGGGRRRGREQAERLIEEVERSGLIGRGGAAFPAGTKMRAVASARGRAIVLANGVEAEPASLKDLTLMSTLPHLVIDGGVLAAEAVGADEVVIAVGEPTGAAAATLQDALDERQPERGTPRVSVTRVPRHFVAGQETAVISHVDGGACLPTSTPPRPFERGVRGRPTLVCNVETLAHIALIARHGARWFRALGTAARPGSTLVTLSGPVRAPGVYEIEPGATLASLIAAAGGLTSQLGGALIGGVSGGWLSAERLSGLALSDEALTGAGSAIGAGVIVLLSDRACPVAETARLARWLASQSAHQCGPCVFGLDALANLLAHLSLGTAGSGAGARLNHLASRTSGRGACAHPDASVRVLLSAVRAFQEDFSEHARDGACAACSRPPELVLGGGRPPEPPMHGKRVAA